MAAGMFQDDKGNTSSGRLQTTATVFVGLGLAIVIGMGEWQGTRFSANLHTLVIALTVGGAGMKGLQKFSERELKPTPVAFDRNLQVNDSGSSANQNGQELIPIEVIRKRGEL